MAEDLSFTFDTDIFKRGIAQVTKGMDTMQTSATTVARGISKGFNAVIGKLAVLKGAFMAIKSTLNQMPEIGQAFGIAKNVFLKNLLFPLRKEIMPLLQQMMDWVRDNRTLFVKWGQTLATIFRAAVSGFKTLLGWAQSITKTLFNSINDMFGTTINSFDDLINIVSFKIATVIEFLKILAKPILDAFIPVGNMLKDNLLVLLNDVVDIFITIASHAGEIGTVLTTAFFGLVDIFGKISHFVLQIIDSFAGGYLEGVKGIEGPLKRILESISGVVDLLFTGEGPLKFWKDVFEGLGFVIGTTIKLAFEGIAIVLETIETVIQKIKDFFTSEAFGNFIDNTVKLFEAVGKNLAIGAEAQKAAGVPTGGGLGIAAAFGPDGGGPAGGFPGVNNNIDLSGLNINVTNTDNPDDLGPAIGEAVVNFLRDAYDNEFTKGGF